MTDVEFITNIISEICNYAVENEMEPDDTIRPHALSPEEALKLWNGRADDGLDKT